MESTGQNPLTRQEMDTLADQARGFFGAPQPAALKEAMLALDPAKPDDLAKFAALKGAHEELKYQVGRQFDHVHTRVRNLLGLPQTAQQDVDEWHYAHPGM